MVERITLKFAPWLGLASEKGPSHERQKSAIKWGKNYRGQLGVEFQGKHLVVGKRLSKSVPTLQRKCCRVDQGLLKKVPATRIINVSDSSFTLGH